MNAISSISLCLAVVITVCAGHHDSALAQSTSIDLPGETTNSMVNSGQSFATGLPEEIIMGEAILDQAFPRRFMDEMTAGKMVSELQQIGLPVVIDSSALDDQLDNDTFIQMELPTASLRTRLLQTFKHHNATLTWANNTLQIISLDDASLPEYFFTIVYDVTRLNYDPEKLIQVMQGTIAVDSWMDTGMGEATLEPIDTNSQQLIVVTHDYYAHRQIVQLLASIAPATSIPRRSSRRASRPGGARPVALPTVPTRVTMSTIYRSDSEGAQRSGGGVF